MSAYSKASSSSCAPVSEIYSTSPQLIAANNRSEQSGRSLRPPQTLLLRVSTLLEVTAQLVVKSLEASHGSRVLFSGLDLVVAPGDVIGLLGPNGPPSQQERNAFP